MKKRRIVKERHKKFKKKFKKAQEYRIAILLWSAFQMRKDFFFILKKLF